MVYQKQLPSKKLEHGAPKIAPNLKLRIGYSKKAPNLKIRQFSKKIAL